jgi:hypothetical protein
MLALAFFTVPASAAPTTYSGEAAVTSQSEAERGEALKSALADVVIRLSGDSGVLARSDVARAVGDAAKYVLQYQYRRDASGGAALTLVAQFDSVAVDQMLSQLGLAGSGSPVAIDTTPSESRVWISGIHSATDYARVLGYLSRQSIVRQAQPVEARGDGLLVKLNVAGSLARWLEAVGGDGTLRVNNASPPVEGVDATLALAP